MSTDQLYVSSKDDLIVSDCLFRHVDDVLVCYEIKTDINNKQTINQIASDEEATVLLEVLQSNEALVKPEKPKAPQARRFEKMERIIKEGFRTTWVFPKNKDSFLGTHIGNCVQLIDDNFLIQQGDYQLAPATPEIKMFWSAVYDGLTTDSLPELMYNLKRPYDTVRNYVLARRYYLAISSNEKLKSESLVKFYPFFGTVTGNDDKYLKNKQNLTTLLGSIFDLEYIENIKHILGLFISLVPVNKPIVKLLQTALIDLNSINRTGVRSITSSQPVTVGKKVKMVTTQESVWPKSSISGISTVPFEYSVLRDLKKRFWYSSFTNKQLSDYVAQYGFKAAKEWARNVYAIRWKFVDLMRRYKNTKLQFMKDELKSLKQTKNTLTKIEDFRSYFKLCNPKRYSDFITSTLHDIFPDALEEFSNIDYYSIASKIEDDIRALRSIENERVMPSYLQRPADKSIAVRDEIEDQLFSLTFDIHSTFSSLDTKIGQELSTEDPTVKSFCKRSKPLLLNMVKWLKNNEASDFIINTGASILTGRDFYKQVYDTVIGDIKNNNLFLHLQPTLSSNNYQFVSKWIKALNLGVDLSSKQSNFDLRTGRIRPRPHEEIKKISSEEANDKTSIEEGFVEKVSKKDYKIQKRSYKKSTSEKEVNSDNEEEM